MINRKIRLPESPGKTFRLQNPSQFAPREHLVKDVHSITVKVKMGGDYHARIAQALIDNGFLVKPSDLGMDVKRPGDMDSVFFGWPRKPSDWSE